MKKLKMYLMILIMAVSVFTPNYVSKVYGDIVPFALIKTVDDETTSNKNNTIETAFDKTDGSFTDPKSYYCNLQGLIKTSTDKDFYKFNVYGDSRITIQLGMIDSSQESFYNYDFTLYKHENDIGVDRDDIVVLATTNASGASDYYGVNVIPGTYYLEIFGRNGDCSSRNSYDLDLTITIETKHTINLDTYIPQNPDSYVLWTSDFNLAERKDLVNMRNELFTYIPEYFYPSDIIQEFSELGGFVNMEIYLWGTSLRQSVSNTIDSIISNLIHEKNELIDNRELYLSIKKGINAAGLVYELVATIQGKGEFVIHIFTGVNMLLEMFLMTMYNPGVVEDIDILIQKLNDFKTSLNSGYGTSETEVICLTQKSSLIKKNVNALYYTNEYDTSCSRYVDGHQYQHNVLYDMKDSLGIDGKYFKVCGDLLTKTEVESYI